MSDAMGERVGLARTGTTFSLPDSSTLILMLSQRSAWTPA